MSSREISSDRSLAEQATRKLLVHFITNATTITEQIERLLGEHRKLVRREFEAEQAKQAVQEWWDENGWRSAE